MRNIANTYQLNFIIKNTNGKNYGLCETHNPTFRTLSNFITCIPWTIVASDVIDGLNDILNQQIQSDEFETQNVIVEASFTHCLFFDGTKLLGINSPDLTIPTVDLRDIMVEWKSFLQLVGV